MNSECQFRRIAVIFNHEKRRQELDHYCAQVQACMPQSHIEVVSTSDLSTGLQTARDIHESGVDLLVAAGGDGTVLSVVNAAVDSRIPITILPLGTANDYANALGIHSVTDAVTTTNTGTIGKLDTGLCTYYDWDGKRQETTFCSTAGIGLFAHLVYLETYAISRAMKRLLGNGAWPFLAATSILASRSVMTNLQIASQFDGKPSITTIHTNMYLCEFSKVRRAGGFLLTPDATFNSGYFDSWLVHNIANKLRIWPLLAKALANKAAHLRDPGVDYFSKRPEANRFGYSHPTRITIEPKEPMMVHLNGEIVGQTPATFEIQPESLRVLKPDARLS